MPTHTEIGRDGAGLMPCIKDLFTRIVDNLKAQGDQTMQEGVGEIILSRLSQK